MCKNCLTRWHYHMGTFYFQVKVKTSLYSSGYWKKNVFVDVKIFVDVQRLVIKVNELIRIQNGKKDEIVLCCWCCFLFVCLFVFCYCCCCCVFKLSTLIWKCEKMLPFLWFYLFKIVVVSLTPENPYAIRISRKHVHMWHLKQKP